MGSFGRSGQLPPAPGTTVLTSGLRRLLDLLHLEAILNEEVREHGSLPLRISTMFSRTLTRELRPDTGYETS